MYWTDKSIFHIYIQGQVQVFWFVDFCGTSRYKVSIIRGTYSDAVSLQIHDRALS